MSEDEIRAHAAKIVADWPPIPRELFADVFNILHISSLWPDVPNIEPTGRPAATEGEQA